MPDKSTTEYNKELQKRIENLRNGLKNIREQRWEWLTQPKQIVEEQPNQETIEDIPVKEVNINWINAPRIRTHGGFTNINTKKHIKIWNNGGKTNSAETI